jgi:hypothetical protein
MPCAAPALLKREPAQPPATDYTATCVLRLSPVEVFRAATQYLPPQGTSRSLSKITGKPGTCRNAGSFVRNRAQ